MSVRAVGLFMVLILLICVACSGCAAFDRGDDTSTAGLWFLACIGTVLMFAPLVEHGLRKGWRLASMFALFVVVLVLSGCAALPMPMQPQAASNSNAAEGAWLVLHAMDTMQTVQIARHHNCLRESEPAAAWIYGTKYPSEKRVILTNVAGALVHTMVTSWLDDEVDAHRDSSAWLWGRRTWLAVSLAYSGYSVVHNVQQGIYLNSVHNKDCGT